MTKKLKARHDEHIVALLVPGVKYLSENMSPFGAIELSVMRAGKTFTFDRAAVRRKLYEKFPCRLTNTPEFLELYKSELARAIACRE